MDRVRQAFLDASDVAHALLRSDAVAQRWEEPSALYEWSVKGLAGHLVRNTAGVEGYLDAEPDPAGDTLSAPAYYVGVLEDDGNLDSDFHRAIRQRGDDMASEGHEALGVRQHETIERLRKRLAEEPPERKVQVFQGFVMLLDDYLTTRILELTCHIDDLAVSVGVPTPQLPLTATDITIRLLTALARHRHGDLVVIRSLARRERVEGPLRIL